MEKNIAQPDHNLKNTMGAEYLESRGISIKTAEKYGVCFDPNSTAGGTRSKPAIIIPSEEGSFFARDIRPNLSDAEKQYSKIKSGPAHLFNETALDTNDDVFVVEGEFDALSFIEIGFPSVALCGINNFSLLLAKLSDSSFHPRLLISLDQDDAGRNATNRIIPHLIDKGYRCKDVSGCICSIDGNIYKDPNEALVASRDAFYNNVLLARLEDQEDQSLSRTQIELLKLMDDQYHCVEQTLIPTPFERLNTALYGGLQAGLYVIGAQTSMGKTTFTLQLAEYIAKSLPVIYFSLETETRTLLSKILSRMSFELTAAGANNCANAKASLDFLLTQRFREMNEEDKKLVDKCNRMLFQTTAKNLYFYERKDIENMQSVESIVENVVKETKRTPVIMIDYLQLLAELNELQGTDKQNIDNTTHRLKRMADKYHAPVIVLSSFNRESYNKGTSASNFKESGCIEYDAEVLMALQYHGIDSPKGIDPGSADGKMEILNIINKNERSPIRTVDLKIIKFKNGEKTSSVQFQYYPKFNYFREIA